ncbi:hypothetical protein [Xanthomonas arboricola]|uniref:hypothetical protein n=1 Tax=Xanthomonas arboricola TaxID=56448 RepID=UPI003EBCB435
MQCSKKPTDADDATVRQASPWQAHASAARGFAVLPRISGTAIEIIDGVEW